MSTSELLVRRLFTADLRSLAALRIGTALVLLGDLAGRTRDLRELYTDAGVLPRRVLFERPGGWISNTMSLHLLGGSLGFQGMLFAAAAVLGLMLLVGYRTRLATVLSFVLLVSLHQRNPFVLYGGDGVLKMLLFWGIFLPWGAWLSFDRKRVAAAPLQVFSGGVAACMVQVAIIYLFSALAKTGAEWRSEFTAIYYALSLDAYVGPLGWQLYRHPVLMKLLTAGTLAVEWLSAPLLFSPWWTSRLRLATVLGVASLHLGIGLTMRVGFFWLINIISLLIFVPGEVWDRLGVSPAQPPASEPPAPAPAASWRQDLPHLVPIVLAGYIVAWNIGIPAPLVYPGLLLKIDQQWNMFSPMPPRDDGWFVVAGTLSGGEQVDLLRNGAPLSWDKPANVAALYHGERWNKYYQRMWENRERPSYLPFWEYQCRHWNASHSGNQTLVTVEPFFVVERTLPDYRTSPPRPVSLGKGSCSS